MKINDILVEYISNGHIDNTSKYTTAYLEPPSNILFINSNELLSTPINLYLTLSDQGWASAARLIQGVLSIHAPYSYESIESIKKDLKAVGSQLLQIVSNHLVLSDLSKIDPNKNQLEIAYVKEKVSSELTVNSVIKSLASAIVYQVAPRNSDELVSKVPKNLYSVYFGEGVVIDHQSKTIKRIDTSADSNTRMGNYKRTGEYVLPKASFSITSAVQFQKIAQYLQKQLPDYQIELDTPGHENLMGKISAVLDGKGTIKAYHGTSLSIYNQSIKDQALKPGLGPDYGDKIKGHSEHLLYFTLDPNVARRYGVRAAGARPYVILEVELRDLSRIKFDEDSLYAAVKNFLSSKRRTDLAIKRLLPPKLTDTFILWDLIKRQIKNPNVSTDSYEGVTPELLAKIVNYLTWRAVKTMQETSFGYRGSIPMSQVTVYEKNKTVKFSDKTTADDYARVAAGTRSPSKNS